MNNHQILINNIESEDWKLAKIGAIQDNLKIGAWVANSTKKWVCQVYSYLNFNIRRKV